MIRSFLLVCGLFGAVACSSEDAAQSPGADGGVADPSIAAADSAPCPSGSGAADGGPALSPPPFVMCNGQYGYGQAAHDPDYTFFLHRTPRGCELGDLNQWFTDDGVVHDARGDGAVADGTWSGDMYVFDVVTGTYGEKEHYRRLADPKE